MTLEDLDARSLALHRHVAKKVRTAPELLQVATDNLARWRGTGTVNPLFDEWARLLDAGLDIALQAATEDTDVGAVLRRASPFAGVLSRVERDAIFAAWRVLHDAH